MRVALIGIGRWGQVLAKYIPSHFTLAADANSKSHLYKIWDDQSIEAVIIATPPDTHYSLVTRALTAGKHVLCEKPLTMNANEAIELKKLSIQKNVQLFTDYIMTFSPALIDAATRYSGIDYFYSLRWRPYALSGNVGHILLCHDLAVLDMFHNLDDIEFSIINAKVRGITIHGKSKIGSLRCVLTAALDIPWKKTIISVREKNSNYSYPNIGEGDLIDKALHQFKQCIAGEIKSNIDRAVRVTRMTENVRFVVQSRSQ